MRELEAKGGADGPRGQGGSRFLRLEAETGDPPASMELEANRPAANPHHRWQAEDELRD